MKSKDCIICKEEGRAKKHTKHHAKEYKDGVDCECKYPETCEECKDLKVIFLVLNYEDEENGKAKKLQRYLYENDFYDPKKDDDSYYGSRRRVEKTRERGFHFILYALTEENKGKNRASGTYNDIYCPNGGRRIRFDTAEEFMKWHKGRNPNNNTIMQKLTSTLKRVLSKSLQAQYRAGLRNGDLELTERGKQELLEILAQEHEAPLTKVAEEIIEDEQGN